MTEEKESAVKVCVRVRPLVEREVNAASEDSEPVKIYWKADQKSIHHIDDGSSNKSFSFDRVFAADETTNHLYQTIAKPLVVSAVEGYNGTVFAYGQTSSGKTFTMMGSDLTPGVLPLAVEDVFKTIKSFPKKEFLLRVSYMEIYNETVTDLLVDSWKRKPLEVRETINKNIYVADLTEELVTSPAQALAWIRKGEKNRHYGKTKMNQRSSRSHTIFRMIIESRERSDPASGENADGAIIVSHLNLVDLAGSERASQTGALGARFKEGCNINRSLFILGQVIKKLTDDSQTAFINYRDSKLTRILQNSLGGNAKTLIICTITPAALDETLGTLQFASTAKKMKNDPHVTEVMDDGALLKRYRNEIVDLKRRLLEVSSVTQTTATEKEVLSQLLQEKDQLQRDQEDRIKNLTKLLVTSSNLVPAQKIPKRRVTWGGKMLRAAVHSPVLDDTMSDSFVDPSSQKSKRHLSCLMEQIGEDEDFDSHWEIGDEPSDDISESSVTVRSFGDSPGQFLSPERISELTQKVSSLQLKLETEIKRKEEAEKFAEMLENKVLELQLKLETELLEKQQAFEKTLITDQRLKDLETEAQEKLEMIEKLQFTVTQLEKQLEEQNCTENQQIRREFAETVHLCETLASEKEMVVSERDYLNKELGMFMEQIQHLEKEKASLAQELKERTELDEFSSLEEGIRKEQEKESQNEIDYLKKANEAAELRCQELQSKLEDLSEELKKKTEFTEELQKMSGKDLVQEVVKLRRSLDDAEGLSRDTKKEWALLRSQNMNMEETNATLTADLEKLQTENTSLLYQLQTEKSRYKRMETDLQKELNIAFDENTKLTSLMSGKVSQNLIDNVELERTIAGLNQKLKASQEAEGTLRAHLEELVSLQTLPDQDNLVKQVSDLTEELEAVKIQRDNLLSSQSGIQLELQQLRDFLQTSQDEIVKLQMELSASRQREEDLSLQHADASQQLESLRSDLCRSDAERKDVMALLQERDEEAAEFKALLKSVQDELQEQKQKNSELMKNSEFENDEAAVQCEHPAEEVEKLLSAVASLTAERDQLKLDMQENVEMMIENQEDLRKALDTNREQMKQIKLLTLAQSKPEEREDIDQQLQSLEAKIKSLSEELESVQSDRDHLLSEMSPEAQLCREQTETLLCKVASLSEERNQLQETLESLKQENQQLTTEMQETKETLQAEIKAITEQLEVTETQRDQLLSERKDNTSYSTEEVEKLLTQVSSISTERDQLQEILEGLKLEKQQLREEFEEKIQMLSVNQPAYTDVASHLLGDQERAAQLQQEVAELQDVIQEVTEQKIQVEADLQQSREMIKAITEQLEASETQRDELLSERKSNTFYPTEEVEKLLAQVSSISTERDQLHEILEGLKLEKQQLREEFEEKIQMLSVTQPAYTDVASHLVGDQERAAQLQQEVSELQDVIQEVTEQKIQVEADLQQSREMIKTITEQLKMMETQRDELLSERKDNTSYSTEEVEKILAQVSSISTERDQLQKILEGLKLEKQQLREEFGEKIQMVAELQDAMQEVTEQKIQVEADLQQSTEMIKTVTEQLKMTETQRDELLSERKDNTSYPTEEVEKLVTQVSSISTERDQLQEILEGLKLEKQQLREEFGEKIQMVAELQDVIQEVTEQKIQMEADLQQSREMIKAITEQLEVTETQRDELLSERKDNTCSSTEEVEKLLAQVSSISTERDQLQEILEGLKLERQQLREEFEEKIQMLSVSQPAHTDMGSHLLGDQERAAQLQQEVAELQNVIQEVTEQKIQVEADLQQSREMVSMHEERLQSLQEQFDQQSLKLTDMEQIGQEEQARLQQQLAEMTRLLQEQKQTECDLMKLSVQKESELEQQIKILTEELDCAQEEIRTLTLENHAADQTSNEVENLLSKVRSLTEERDQQQEILQDLREEMKEKLETKEAELHSTREHPRMVQEKLRAQMIQCPDNEKLSQEKQNASNQQISELLDKLEAAEAEKTSLLESRSQWQQTEMILCKERDELLDEKLQLKAQLEDRMQTISNLQVNISQQEQTEEKPLREDGGNVSPRPVDQGRETLWIKQQDSTKRVEESLGKFQHIINMFEEHPLDSLYQTLRDKQCWNQMDMSSYPESVVAAYYAVWRQEMLSLQSLRKIREQLEWHAVDYAQIFEKLLRRDVAIYEEKRLQDLLLCRVQADSFSIKDEDFHSLWEIRMKELLDKRQLYLQQMEDILEKLPDTLTSYLTELDSETSEREKLQQELLAVNTKEPLNFSVIESVLRQELERRSKVQERKRPLIEFIDDQMRHLEELKDLEAQAESELTDEKSKTSTLLQTSEEVPLKTEVSLLQEVQSLNVKLQQAEKNIRVLHEQIEELEKAQANADMRASNQKEATQLLQTELQDSRALNEQKDVTIQTLRRSLDDSELEKIKNQLFQTEMRLSLASDEHEQEKRRITTLLQEKEESLRSLKEHLRRSQQQQGEESFLQGKELRARLTKPRGPLTESSLLQEKTKLEQEVKQLQLKIVELESLVTSLRAEISKWKNRATNLKMKSKLAAEKPLSPRTPTKRNMAMTSESVNVSSPKKLFPTPKSLKSPKKISESPAKRSLLGSPKSRFFDLEGSSNALSRSFPKQFFDNSKLGIPEALLVSDSSDKEKDDGAVDPDEKELWPTSPKMEEMCKNQ